VSAPQTNSQWTFLRKGALGAPQRPRRAPPSLGVSSPTGHSYPRTYGAGSYVASSPRLGAVRKTVSNLVRSRTWTMPCTIGLATVWRTAGTMRVRCYAAANWMPSDVAAALRGFCVPGQNHSKQKHDGPDASGDYFVHMNLPYAQHSRQSEKRFTLAQSPLVLLRSSRVPV
jgi:hypothetical protein